jgi:hypothetical protein
VVLGGFSYDELPVLSLSLDADSIDLSGPPNVLLADYLTANVITNNELGYHLDVEADEARLKCGVSGDYIEALPTVGAMTSGYWGVAVGDGSLSVPSVWTGLPALAVDSFGGATDLVNGRDTVIWFGTKVGYDKPACEYVGVVTVTAVAGGGV